MKYSFATGPLPTLRGGNVIGVTKCKEMLPVIQAAKHSKEVISRNFINWCKTGDIESVKANIRMVDVNYQDSVHKNTG